MSIALPVINESIKIIIQELEKISGVLELSIKEDAPISDDILYPGLKKFVREQKKISASMIQRKFRVGYARAAMFLDKLEEDGIVGPSHGASPRKVIG